MDVQELLKLNQLTDELLDYSRMYEKILTKANTARDSFKLVLASNISAVRKKKSNVGMDMAELMLMEPGFLPVDQVVEVQGYWKEWKENETKVDTLKELMDAIRHKISFAQSSMRYEKENT